jgi:ketosteroid isomerase-like protein
MNEQSWPEAEVRAAVDRYVAARERLDRGEGDWTELADFFTEDAVFVDPAWGRIEGRNGIRRLYAEAMAGLDLTFPIDFTAISGNWVVVKWRQVFPGSRPDGRPWQQPAVSTLLYAGNGLFRYEEDLMNVAAVMEDIVASGWEPGPEFTPPPPNPDRNFDPEPTR